MSSRCPGNGSANTRQAVWKHKRCWMPALDFHHKQIPGQGPVLGGGLSLYGSRQPTFIFLCHPDSREPHATLARSHIIYQSDACPFPSTSPKQGMNFGFDWVFHPKARCAHPPSCHQHDPEQPRGSKAVLEKFKFPTGYTLTLAWLLHRCFSICWQTIPVARKAPDTL